MQIVGSTCKACGKPVSFLAEGIACSHCTVAFHRACLPETTVCPVCHEDMAARAARELAAAAASQNELLRVGRRRMQLCLGLLATLAGFNLLAPIVVGSAAAFAVQPWVQSLWLAGLSYWTWCGILWARVLLAIPVLMSVFAYGSHLQRLAPTASPLVIAYLLASLAAALVVFWCLAFSSSVRFFLAAQRQPQDD